MTTPPAAASRVVELIDELARQCSEWGTATSEPAVAARAALVAAIAKALEEARQDSERYRAALQTISFAKADRLDHSIDADLLDKAGRIARKALRP